MITAAARDHGRRLLSFVIGDDAHITKHFGLGLAPALLVDATIVRMILVPATWSCWAWNWWFPTWLDRILPRLHVEPAEGDPAPTGEHPVVTQGD